MQAEHHAAALSALRVYFHFPLKCQMQASARGRKRRATDLTQRRKSCELSMQLLPGWGIASNCS